MPSAYLWCPAYPLADAERVVAARSAAAGLATSLGCELHESPTLAEPGPRGGWAPAELRRAEFAQALAHDVLLPARGGYGCLDLVADVLAWPGRGGLLIGYSDVTVLHAAWRRRGWGETIYGFLPGVDHGPRARASTLALARGESLVCTRASNPAVAPLRAGTASGWCFAACLRVLAGLVGTPAMPDLRGAVLALEDIDERPYQIDRDLTQLHRSGALDGVVAVVFARFPASLPPDYAGPSTLGICSAWSERLAIPAISGLPIGHDPDPLSLACGRATRLMVDGDDWRLELAARQ
jgi:muramoyltetrapeptide carboxypeptidase